MKYCFYQFLSGKETEVNTEQALLLVQKSVGRLDVAIERLAKLDSGKLDYISVSGGRIEREDGGAAKVHSTEPKGPDKPDKAYRRIPVD